MIRIVFEEIDLSEILNAVRDPAGGGTVLFIGTTRNQSEGRTVLSLEYEAYAAMALRMMEEIAAEAKERWDLCRTAMVHRVGKVGIGEASVAIAVSAPHRKEAFEACRFCIDRLKQNVPIWKKEWFADGGEWVEER